MAEVMDALSRQSTAVLVKQLTLIQREFKSMSTKGRGLLAPIKKIYELSRRLDPNRKKMLYRQQADLESALASVVAHSSTQDQFLAAGVAAISKKKLGVEGDPMVDIQAILQDFTEIANEVRDEMDYLTNTMSSTCYCYGIRNINYTFFKLQ